MASDDQMYQMIADFTEVKTTLGHMASDLRDVKADTKQLREGAPLHRIEKLEGRWKAMAAWCGGLTIALLSAIFVEVMFR